MISHTVFFLSLLLTHFLSSIMFMFDFLLEISQHLAVSQWDVLGLGLIFHLPVHRIKFILNKYSVVQESCHHLLEEAYDHCAYPNTMECADETFQKDLECVAKYIGR